MSIYRKVIVRCGLYGSRAVWSSDADMWTGNKWEGIDCHGCGRQSSTVVTEAIA